MGLSHVAAAAMNAKLAPQLSVEAPAGPGHKRGTTSLKADKTDIGLRGVPVIGHGSGAISLTAPGGELGNAARLEQAARDIVRAHRNRFKAANA